VLAEVAEVPNLQAMVLVEAAEA